MRAKCPRIEMEHKAREKKNPENEELKIDLFCYFQEFLLVAQKSLNLKGHATNAQYLSSIHFNLVQRHKMKTDTWNLREAI